MQISRSGWRVLVPEEPDIVRIEEPAVADWFRANYYLVRGATADLVIDTGTGIVPLCPDLECAGARRLIAVATHIHIDHVGGLHEFEDRLGSRAEAAYFTAMPERETRAGSFRKHPQVVSRLPGPDWSVSDFRLIAAPLTRLLDDGDLIDLGNRKLHVLHLPGHSPGSIALHDRDRGQIFTGDILYDGVLVDSLPHSCRRDYIASMQRLLQLEGIERVFPGHNQPISGVRMRELIGLYLDRTAEEHREC